MAWKVNYRHMWMRQKMITKICLYYYVCFSVSGSECGWFSHRVQSVLHWLLKMTLHWNPLYRHPLNTDIMTFPLGVHIDWVPFNRAVTKISSCHINTTNRQGIKQLGISFGSIFLLFSYEVSQGPRSYSSLGKSQPSAVNDSPVCPECHWIKAIPPFPFLLN